MKTGVIYGVKHKADAKICYVGQTRQKPAKRWAQYNHGRTPMAQALQMLGGVNEFEFIILEEVPVDELNDREIHWVNELRTMAPAGLNQLPGGRVCAHTDITRARISEATRGLSRSPETRAKMAASTKSWWSVEDNRLRQSEINLRSWKDPERRQKHREMMHRRLEDDEVKAQQEAARLKGIATWRGQKHSDETRALISERQKQRWKRLKEAG